MVCHLLPGTEKMAKTVLIDNYLKLKILEAGHTPACASFSLGFQMPNSAYSSFSMPTFFTFGFQILSGIQAGAPAGLSTCNLSPVNTCTFLVPRSRSLISV